MSKTPTTKWTVRKVGDFIHEIGADIAVSLDIPPHLLDSTQQRRGKITKSAANYMHLSERFPHKTIMPVVHGRTIAELEFSLNLIHKRLAKCEWIALGGVVPLLQNRTTSGLNMPPEIFIAAALVLLRSFLPDKKIHVFGAGGPRTFPAVYAMGADSADSIGWRQAAGFGSIFLPMKSQRAVIWNSDGRPPRKTISCSDLLLIEACLCPICIGRKVEERISAFKEHFHNRAIHNAWTTVNQTRLWPRSRAALRDALLRGILGPAWAKAAELKC